jgi:hypothetical protein
MSVVKPPNAVKRANTIRKVRSNAYAPHPRATAVPASPCRRPAQWGRQKMDSNLWGRQKMDSKQLSIIAKGMHGARALAQQDEVASWLKEGRQLQEDRQRRAETEGKGSVLNMSIEQLFHVEPSRRGQRRANLFKQRMVCRAGRRAVVHAHVVLAWCRWVHAVCFVAVANSPCLCAPRTRQRGRRRSERARGTRICGRPHVLATWMRSCTSCFARKALRPRQRISGAPPSALSPPRPSLLSQRRGPFLVSLPAYLPQLQLRVCRLCTVARATRNICRARMQCANFLGTTRRKDEGLVCGQPRHPCCGSARA